MTDMIPIARCSFGPEEEELVLAALRSGWVAQGPMVERFEQEFGQFCQAAHCVAVTSCTTALHLTLAALGVGPGDEVIVPAFTWCSTANVVEHLGGKAVFCDIDLDTFNLDVAQVESLITPHTVGLLPVHLFGLCAPLESLLVLASQRGLWLVEDAACAFGSTYQGQPAGTLGRAGCFSFHPRKSITTGEGGMIVTDDAALAGRLRSLRNHGAGPASAPFLLPDYPEAGYNYRLTDLQAALGLAQLRQADHLLAERKRVASGYLERLELPWLRLPQAGEGHSWQSFVTLYAPEEPLLSSLDQLYSGRNRLMQSLEAKGVSTRQGTHAPVLLGYYREKYGLRPEQFPGATLADRLSLALPLFAGMTEGEQAQVVSALAQH